MTDKPEPLSTQVAVSSQNIFPQPSASPVKEVARKVEPVEEEPYTIKCICNFSDDDGNTIYCETCDTWQHIDCFYPDNRDEAIREDFAHSCAECKPRPLDRQKAIERTLRLRNAVVVEETIDKKSKRPPSKNHKRKPKPNDITILTQNGTVENGKNGAQNEHVPTHKKSKSTTHRPSQSISSQPSKRSPSYGNSRTQPPTHPLSPATTPPDLPDDFQIHHYSAGFCSLYNEHDVPETHNNAFASIQIPTALSRWLRDPSTMQEEVGRGHSDVFQDAQSPNSDKTPKLEVADATRSLDPGTTLRWRSLKSPTPIEKDVPLIELHGEIGFQKDYCANPENLWGDLSSPLPFVFFHPVLPLYIDTRKEGSLARYVRRSCKPNAQLDTYLSSGSEYHFWLVSDRYIPAGEQITLPWDFRLEKSVCPRWLHLLGLSEDEAVAQDESEMDEAEYTAISNWIDRILSEYGGCACELENNCAFARFHRHYLFGKNHSRSSHSKKKQRKAKAQTISPSSTGQATNSRAASEGHIEDALNNDGRYESASSRSKPPSRERSPLRQGSFDQLGILTEPTDRDKRKVAMVEDSFRRMEQQPPAKKKKRTSDGATNSTCRSSKSRNGSAQPNGYVDSGTSRSKSGSPASVQSPTFENNSKSPSGRPESVARSRQSSATPRPRPDYCNASVQTDPVDGEWFSEPTQSPRPKKKVIPLCRRLLNSRHRVRMDNGMRSSLAGGQPPGSSAMDLDVSSSEQKLAGVAMEAQPKSEGGDVAMTDVPLAPLSSAIKVLDEKPGTTKSPDLRVQLPPVPTFETTVGANGSITTPLSASSSMAQSPLSVGNISSPFVSPVVNGIGIQASPVKKKLSLSDYKSRMNKTGVKGSSGPPGLRSSLSSPEDLKGGITVDAPPLERHESDISSTATSITTKGT